jgi:filamentous hemagglutinin family protein
MILLFFLFSANPSVYALPQGYEVVSGDVQFDQIDANTLHITASDQAIINFSSFNIGSGETVQFFQPGSSSSVLSRVTGEGASSILGNLFANGQLILVNPYGMSFGPSANVQVGSLIASTLDITNQDYLARNYTFSKNPNLAAGLIVNEGLIQTNQAGGLIALMSPNIRNSGTITAQLGTVALVSGDRLTMSFDQDGLISFVIEDPIQAVSSDQPDTAIHNIGQIIADGGIVLIQAKSALGLIDKVINNEGLIQARSMVERQGHIFLEGGTTGLVVNRGTLDTSSAVSGVDAGEIKMNGEYVSTSGLIKATASDNAKGGHVDLSSTKITALTSLNTIDVSGRGEASDSGDVRIWSDENTYFQTGSRILANGGEISGDGGLIEVSGHDNVFINGSVQAQAVNGESGMFFIDPTNLEITNGSSAGSGSDFTGDLPSIGGGSVGAGYITEASLEALAATVNISIVATGTITLNDLSDNVLTLATNAAHSVTLSGAAFTMNSGDTINVTGGGTLTILTTGASGITVGGLTTNNAAIQLTSYTATTVNGAIASNGGSVTIYNDANDSGSDGNFTMNSGSSITSGGGAITIVSGILNGGGTTLGTYTLRTLSSSGGSGNIIVANGISSAGSITQAGNITTGTGYYSGVWGTGGYTMNFGTSITTGGGISLGLTSQGTPSGSVSLQTLTTSGGFTCCGGGHQYSVYANTSGSLTLNEAITASASSSSVDLGIYLKGSTSLTQNSSATITASHASRQALAMETNGAMTLNANITAGNTALGFDEDISGAENFTANASIDASGYLLIYQGNGVSGGGNITLGNDSGDTVTVGSTNIGNPPNVSFYAKTNGTITTNAAITSSSGIYLDADVNSNGSGTQLTIGNTITATNNNVTLSGGNGSVVQNANITSGTFASYFGDSYTMAPGTSLTATGGASFGLTGGSGPTGDITLRTLDVSGSFSCCGGGTYTMYVVTSGNVSIEGGSVSGSGDIQVISDSDGNGSGNLSTGTTNLNGNAILIASGDLQNSQTGGGDVTIGGSITSSSTADFGGGLPAILIGSFEGSVVLGANVTNTSTGQVVIIAGDEITMNSSVAVTGNGGEVDFYFDMEGNGAGLEGFTMGSGSSINANSGNVIINSTSVFGGGLAGGGDIVLTSVTGNTVDIQTATGAISDGNGASVNLTASSLTLTSATALGTSSDSLEIAATTLAGATVSGTGGIFLSDTHRSYFRWQRRKR